MECRAALKVRWSEEEVTMLVEEWAGVCSTPGSNTLNGERLSKAIFDRYNGRCIRTGQLRRSPAAVDTQRNRMTRFARFVSDFDCTEHAHGRRPWFELTNDEQQGIEIPLECRRQLTTFTPAAFNIFKDSILPTESTHSGGLKRKRIFTMNDGHRVGDKPRGKVHVERRPCWTSQEEVLLAKRWGHFMEREKMTLAEFMETNYSSRPCRRLESPGRSSFMAWKKLRALIRSWEFITAFNAQHRPGWFELDDNEQDLRLMWGELPDNFEAMEQEVFDAMEKVSLKYGGLVMKEEPKPVAGSVVPLSPLATPAPVPIALEQLMPLALLCPANVGIGTNAPATSDTSLDRLLLEDDDDPESEAEVQQPVLAVVPAVNDVTLLPNACLLLNGKVHGPTETEGDNCEDASKQQPVGLEPVELSTSTSANQTLMSALAAHKKEVEQGIRQFQALQEEEAKRTQDCIRAIQLDGRASANSGGLVKHMELVVGQQNSRLMSALHNAEEICSQNGAEARSLIQELLGSGLDSRRSESSGLDVVVRVATPSRVMI
ncbi:uncharacterized protein IUM83_08119 [Phytophthora cinnamomi]|uniref:uncharacterized protein n=1 Tax=Phytophthora cinnamomi TaxID=4785 RepID=UPI002A34557C|nr:hypothetical protein IUM83_08119 [Phytophthora cinnamomi]KAJ8575750.1 hypothetical protein ON010_g3462 [Phytophthora cinnamomi]